MNLFKSKFFLIFALTLFFINFINAQVYEVPLVKAKYKNSTYSRSNQRIQSDPLTLPFFDDFSTSRDSLNALLWVMKGGTNLNNTHGINPPSINVITFDGVDQFGHPRNDFGNSLLVGASDTLQSNIINLSDKSLDSALYLSFKWQSGGKAHNPSGPQDQLKLYFKRKAVVQSSTNTDSIVYNWKEVYAINHKPSVNFKDVILALDSNIYFHDRFQFQFLSFGNLAGYFDNFHLDYIYLNSKRSQSDTTFDDVAFTKNPTSFLKNYQSMPYYQFRNNPALETADFVKAYVENQYNNFKILPTPLLTITNSKNNSVIQSISPFNRPSPKIEYDNLSTDSLYFKIENLPIEAIGDTLVNLKLKLDLGSGENNGFQRNDTLTTTTTLADYFAYDDGSAERAIEIGGVNTKLAYKFHLNESATLTGLDFYFPEYKVDLSGRSFKLMVWKKIGAVDSTIKTLSVSVIYSGEIDKFTRYNLSKNDYVSLSDTFYIGYQQLRDELYIGLDKNTTVTNKLFYKIGGSETWQSLVQSGSIMIRPVFRNGVVTGTEDMVNNKSYKLFPNPNKGTLQIDGAMDSINLYDALGRLVYESDFFKSESNTINLTHLKPGVYVAHLLKGKMIFTEKIIIEPN